MRHLSSVVQIAAIVIVAGIMLSGTAHAANHKDWSTTTAIAGGRVTAPQNQTVDPATPEKVVLCVGEKTTCTVENATDSDHWKLVNDQGAVLEEGDAEEAVTYKWTGDGTFANANAASTEWTAPAQAGTYSVTCTIDDPWQDGATPAQTGVTAPDTGDRNDAAVTRSVTIYVIGGPITGDNEIRYYCDTGISPAGHASAAGSQPAGTTYKWTIAGPARLMDPNFPVNEVTTAEATFKGTAGSTARDDVTATLVYALAGKECTSTFKITVLKPSALAQTQRSVPTVFGRAHPNGYGFSMQIEYRINDQFGNAMPSISWSETWDDLRRPANANQTTNAPQAIGGGANADGLIVDNLGMFGYNTNPAQHPPPSLIYTMRHRFYAGSLTNGLGCLIQTFANVEYHIDHLAGQ